MSKVRVHELAKGLNLQSKELINSTAVPASAGGPASGLSARPPGSATRPISPGRSCGDTDVYPEIKEDAQVVKYCSLTERNGVLSAKIAVDRKSVV